ncbi:MAG TPA: alpha-L-arabinofuranosidase C-terminal domain-containing protein [Steroidobacteraceae bacterium]|nr:alpha-L-arabinofuranosidase C-terminal domain-containing protein [Steroidobacteraceae bacterium]
MSNTLRALAGALACFFLAGTGVAAAADEPVEISVDAANPGAAISRHLFGQFAEHLGRGVYEGIWVGPDSPIPNTRGIRNDVVAALKAIKVPNVRWPGGCFADEYHWRNGIGPRDRRPATLNPNWGGVIEPNTFGSHEFLDFAQQIGADAYLSINVGSGTAAEAADWLEYLTTPQPSALGKERAANGHPEPYRIAMLGIGNESWGCGGSMTPDYYVSQLKVHARYARNYNAAQKMQRIAVGPDGAHTEYTKAVMEAWKNKTWAWDIEGISLHFYTVVKWPPAFKATGFGEGEYATLLNDTRRMDDLLRTHLSIMDQYDPAKKIALIVDEWGAWLAPTPGSPEGFLEQQNSQRDALIAALNLNMFARHADRVRGANIAQMVNVLQAMILTNKDKMLLTPTYHVFRLYLPFQDATLLPVKVSAGDYQHGDIKLPRVDAIAARDAQGKTWLAVSNLDPGRATQVSLDVTGAKIKRARGETLTSPRVDSVNTFDAPETVAPKPFEARASSGRLKLSLAPASITVVALE